MEKLSKILLLNSTRGGDIYVSTTPLRPRSTAVQRPNSPPNSCSPLPTKAETDVLHPPPSDNDSASNTSSIPDVRLSWEIEDLGEYFKGLRKVLEAGLYSLTAASTGEYVSVVGNM